MRLTLQQGERGWGAASGIYSVIILIDWDAFPCVGESSVVQHLPKMHRPWVWFQSTRKERKRWLPTILISLKSYTILPLCALSILLTKVMEYSFYGCATVYKLPSCLPGPSRTLLAHRVKQLYWKSSVAASNCFWSIRQPPSTAGKLVDCGLLTIAKYVLPTAQVNVQTDNLNPVSRWECLFLDTSIAENFTKWCLNVWSTETKKILV